MHEIKQLTQLLWLLLWWGMMKEEGMNHIAEKQKTKGT